MKPLKTRFFPTAILLLSFFAAAYGQSIPRAWQEIPIFPGASIDQEAQKQTIKDYQEIHAGEPIRDLHINVYTVRTVPDDVCRFYIEKLGAIDEFPEDDSWSSGSVSETKPWYEAGYFQNSWFEEQYEGDIKIWDGKWFKSALSKRQQWIDGEWLQGAYFEWTIILDNGDLARFSIDLIDDDSFDTRAKTVSDKTMITIVSRIEKSEEAIEEEEDEWMDELSEQRMDSFAGDPPTSASLGVPFYPGWVFQPQQSAGMSLNDDYHYYIFTSADEPEKVLAFFEEKMGKKAHDSGYGYIIALKGALPVPDEGVTIQENTMIEGGAKTVITIQKQIRETP